jgi:hypothetical protein
MIPHLSEWWRQWWQRLGWYGGLLYLSSDDSAPPRTTAPRRAVELRWIVRYSVP